MFRVVLDLEVSAWPLASSKVCLHCEDLETRRGFHIAMLKEQPGAETNCLTYKFLAETSF